MHFNSDCDQINKLFLTKFYNYILEELQGFIKFITAFIGGELN